MEKNNNCLGGFGCPHCLSRGPFKIVTSCLATWTDDGILETQDHERAEDGTTECLKCGLVIPTDSVADLYDLITAALEGIPRNLKPIMDAVPDLGVPFIPLGAIRVRDTVTAVRVAVVDPAPAAQPKVMLATHTTTVGGPSVYAHCVSQAVMDMWLAHRKELGV